MNKANNDFRIRLFCLALALIILAPSASAARIIGLNQMQNDQGLSLNSTTLNIFTSNTSRVYITQAGLVGIGTASPGQKFTLMNASNFSVEMSSPGSLSIAVGNATGSNLTTGTYYYKITALDGVGETAASEEISVFVNGTISNSSNISWGAVPGAASYRVWNASSSNGQNSYFNTSSASFIHSGSQAFVSGTLPTATTAYVNKISASGNSWFLGGNVGINTTSPRQALVVVGDLNVTGTSYLSGITIKSDNITTNNVVSKDGGIIFYNNLFQELARFASAGSVGINTSSPTSALHIIGTFNATPAASAASTSLFVNATGGVFYKNGEVCTAENSFCANTGNGWADDGAIVRLVTQSDFVGIGTATPSEKLYVSGNGTFTGDLVVNGNLLSNGGQGSGGNVGGWTDDGTVLRLTTVSDFVGIGTASPTEKLVVVGNATIQDSIKAYGFVNFTNNTAFNQTLYLVNGNVGIGTTGPQRALHIIGIDGVVASFPAVGARDLLVLENNGNTNIGLVSSVTTEGSVKFYDSGAAAFSGIMAYNHNGDYLYLGTNGAEKVRIDSAGNVGIGTANPQGILHVNSSTVNKELMIISNTNPTAGASVPIFLASNSGGGQSNVNIENLGNGSFTVRTGSQTLAGFGTSRFVINATGSIGLGGTISNPSSLTGSNMVVLEGGNVGIGTTSPTSPQSIVRFLHIKGTNAGIVLDDSSDASYVWDIYSSSGNLNIGRNNDATTEINVFPSGTMDLPQNLTVAGNVGIGTTGPTDPLHILTATSDKTLLRLENTNADALPARLTLEHNSASPAANDDLGKIDFYGDDSAANSDRFGFMVGYASDVTSASEDGGFYFSTLVAGSAVRTLDITGGNVGIGTTGPGAKLSIEVSGGAAAARNNQLRFTHVSGADSFNLATIREAASDDIAGLAFLDGSTELMTILSTGNVGIGTTTPTSTLHVIGTENVTGIITSTGGIRTKAGTTAMDSGVATTIFSAASNGMYIIQAVIDGGAAASYTANAIIVSNNGNLVIMQQKDGTLLTLTVSGSNVQATQNSGAGSTITWSYLWIPY